MKIILDPEDIAKIYDILTKLVTKESRDINDLDRIEIDDLDVTAFLRIKNAKQRKNSTRV